MKPLSRMRDVFVTGIGLTAWGYYEKVFQYDIGSKAIMAALKDAAMEWREIQAVFCGSVYQGTASGHQVIKGSGLHGNTHSECGKRLLQFRIGLPPGIPVDSCRDL